MSDDERAVLRLISDGFTDKLPVAIEAIAVELGQRGILHSTNDRWFLTTSGTEELRCGVVGR